MKKILLFLIPIFALFTLTGCGNDGYLKELSYSELHNKMNNKETFFFVVIKDGCSYCESFVPKVRSVLEDNKIEGYTLNISDLSDTNYEKFFEEFGVDSTPTTIFITEGKEVSLLQRIEGNISKEKFISKLKSNNYIK